MPGWPRPCSERLSPMPASRPCVPSAGARPGRRTGVLRGLEPELGQGGPRLGQERTAEPTSCCHASGRCCWGWQGSGSRSLTGSRSWLCRIGKRAGRGRERKGWKSGRRGVRQLSRRWRQGLWDTEPSWESHSCGLGRHRAGPGSWRGRERERRGRKKQNKKNTSDRWRNPVGHLLPESRGNESLKLSLPS